MNIPPLCTDPMSHLSISYVLTLQALVGVKIFYNFINHHPMAMIRIFIVLTWNPSDSIFSLLQTLVHKSSSILNFKQVKWKKYWKTCTAKLKKIAGFAVSILHGRASKSFGFYRTRKSFSIHMLAQLLLGRRRRACLIAGWSNFFANFVIVPGRFAAMILPIEH